MLMLGLMGSKNRGVGKYQDFLPSLPVPPLKATLKKYVLNADLFTKTVLVFAVSNNILCTKYFVFILQVSGYCETAVDGRGVQRHSNCKSLVIQQMHGVLAAHLSLPRPCKSFKMVVLVQNCTNG